MGMRCRGKCHESRFPGLEESGAGTSSCRRGGFHAPPPGPRSPQRRLQINMPLYGYSSLPIGSIRLVRLMPDKDKEAPVRCGIFECPLPDEHGEGGTGLYDDLSDA